MGKLHIATGGILVAIGCALGIIGLATTVWEIRKPTAVENLTGNEVIMSRGLWEKCVKRKDSDDECELKPLAYEKFTVLEWVLRVLMCTGNLLALLSFAFIALWMYSYACKESYAWRTTVFIFASIATLLTLMTTMAYGMQIMTDAESDFVLGWSFFVTIAGAILLGPGNFFLCQYAHYLDDKDNLLYEKHTRSRQDLGEFNSQNRDSSYM